MEPARQELEETIRKTAFHKPLCPVYQNVTAQPSSDPDVLKANLVLQLTSPVKWTQCVSNMIDGGATSFTEVGPGSVLQGLIKKINRDAVTNSAFL
jgi:[acyl-carrier-protein] S-malonyltransferase